MVDYNLVGKISSVNFGVVQHAGSAELNGVHISVTDVIYLRPAELIFFEY